MTEILIWHWLAFGALVVVLLLEGRRDQLRHFLLDEHKSPELILEPIEVCLRAVQRPVFRIGQALEGVQSQVVHDYALRGTFGLDYDLNPCNTVGVFYQTRMDFQFPNAVRFTNPITQTTTYNDPRVAQPQTVGFGLANRR